MRKSTEIRQNGVKIQDGRKKVKYTNRNMKRHVDASFDYIERSFGWAPWFNQFTMLQNVNGPIFSNKIQKVLLFFK